MKKISIGIAMLMIVIVYQLLINVFFITMDEYKFNQSLGLLSEDIKPYERDYLKLIYKRIDKFEKERLEKSSVSLSYKEENLRTFYNKVLNRLTDKYLSEDEAFLSETDSQEKLADKNSLNESRLDNMFSRLKSMVSENDYNDITTLYDKYETSEDYAYIEDIKAIIDNYEEINSDIFVEYLLDPIDMKAYFTLNSQKNLVLKPLLPIIESEPTSSELETYDKIWREIKDKVGTNLLASLDSFIVYSDGKDETLAYVNYIDDKASRWYMAIDIEDSINMEDNSLKEDFYFTIVHELAHVITLNDTQAIYNSEPSFGKYFEEDISFNEDSYLNEFYNRFWTYSIDESRIIQNIDNEDIRYKFFLRHENSFVTDYAATSPSEDIAESFAYFVINEKPMGNEIWEQKIRFFYEFEELVEIKNNIRKRLSSLEIAA
ncbi:Putative zinc-binding metallo-peptidase [Acetoanaerobium noterae]|uniref:Putative zinc-binding metallo-peptidase n=1 Tax=Acetoanaerobium noterae TaxID=745369 RepID=A0A1T5A757_9FIRM|nr:hypothetical protein [Acetoanaerobium noterae]SKB30689.1 Putative zinc-binding metallo-peptidase [Acetoanaerobium noterae]